MLTILSNWWKILEQSCCRLHCCWFEHIDYTPSTKNPVVLIRDLYSNFNLVFLTKWNQQLVFPVTFHCRLLILHEFSVRYFTGATVADASTAGYRTILIDDCCRGVNIDDIEQTKQSLIKNNGIVINSNQVNKCILRKKQNIILTWIMRNMSKT